MYLFHGDIYHVLEDLYHAQVYVPMYTVQVYFFNVQRQLYHVIETITMSLINCIMSMDTLPLPVLYLPCINRYVSVLGCIVNG
jgi:hypothetical protein